MFAILSKYIIWWTNNGFINYTKKIKFILKKTLLKEMYHAHTI